MQTTAERYDFTTIALHWVIALLIAFQWLGAHAIDWFPKGPLRVDARSLHILTGVLVIALLAARIVWRVTKGRRLPPAGSGPSEMAAKALQGLLYLALVAILCGGMATELIRGDSLFGLISLPKLGPWDGAARHALAERIGGYHALAANVILVLAGLHALAALAHHFILKDNVLRRMSPH